MVKLSAQCIDKFEKVSKEGEVKYNVVVIDDIAKFGTIQKGSVTIQVSKDTYESVQVGKIFEVEFILPYSQFDYKMKGL